MTEESALQLAASIKSRLEAILASQKRGRRGENVASLSGIFSRYLQPSGIEEGEETKISDNQHVSELALRVTLLKEQNKVVCPSVLF